MTNATNNNNLLPSLINPKKMKSTHKLLLFMGGIIALLVIAILPTVIWAIYLPDTFILWCPVLTALGSNLGILGTIVLLTKIYP